MTTTTNVNDNNSDDEVHITLLHPPTSNADMIAVSRSTTTLIDLSGYASALLGIQTDNDNGDGGGVGGVGAVLTIGGTILYHPHRSMGSTIGNNDGMKTLDQCGMLSSTSSTSDGGGVLISAYSTSEYDAIDASSSSSSSTAVVDGTRGVGGKRAPPSSFPSSSSSSSSAMGNAVGTGGGLGGGVLDFSSILGGTVGAAGRGGGVAARVPPSSGSGHGALDFTSLVGDAPSASVARSSSSTITNPPSSRPVEWDGMNLDDAIQRNPNPIDLMTLLSNETRHSNLMKELNHHNPSLFRRLRELRGDVPRMAEVWRQTTMKTTMSRFLKVNVERAREAEMRNRLLMDPMDAVANKYFGERIRLENVRAQYERMMEEYPESMGRVLMLYVGTTVNGKSLQVFVDSGAQATIMSSECADRLDLLHLVDERFAGVAVGVGTGKILGRIHVVEMDIGGCVFPCSVTVMDSEGGLGDKNMDCLLGLDMLRRHRCTIDLGSNVLRFSIGTEGETMEAAFLHEKDLPISKGGTMDFDPEKANRLMEARLEKMDTDDDEENKGGVDEDGDGKGGG
ncbi:hypothetical protein ACHAXA_011698 [Cyclostephanos tholiformis]|uniref:Aspartic peptidase DDI1-type domain-containing protein n=1 Tax=Cyclostephanos tholiformis TaxID=382380 RepID=A0ABD3SCM9_9STRA